MENKESIIFMVYGLPEYKDSKGNKLSFVIFEYTPIRGKTSWKKIITPAINRIIKKNFYPHSLWSKKHPCHISGECPKVFKKLDPYWYTFHSKKRQFTKQN